MQMKSFRIVYSCEMAGWNVNSVRVVRIPSNDKHTREHDIASTDGMCHDDMEEYFLGKPIVLTVQIE